MYLITPNTCAPEIAGFSTNKPNPKQIKLLMIQTTGDQFIIFLDYCLALFSLFFCFTLIRTTMAI